jgi:MFS family permease
MSMTQTAPPLSDSERARGGRLAVASNVPGMTFLTAFTGQLATLALISLGTSETLIGVQSGLHLGFQGLQLPALRFVGWFSKRSILVAGQLFAQFATLPLMFFAVLTSLEPATARAIVFASLVLTSIGLNFADLVWFPLLRGYLDPDRIGRFFGVIRSTWHVGVILFFLGGQYWLAGHPGAFGLLFAVAWLAGALRVALLWRLPERSERSATRIRAREALALVRSDRRMRRYLIGICWGAGVRVSVLPFTIVMLRRTLGFSDSEVLLTTIAQFSGGLVSLYLWGALVDRVGPYVVFRFTSLATAALYVGLSQLDSSSSFTLVAAVVFFFLHAVLSAGYGVSDTRVLFELSPPEAPARALVVGGSLTGLAIGLSPALVGTVLDPLLARATDPLSVYHGFFWLAAAVQAVSFLPLRIFRR